MTSIEPETVGAVIQRVTLGANQPEYEPLHVHRIVQNDYSKSLEVDGDSPKVHPRLPVVMRFQLTDEERQRLLDGGDLYVIQSTFWMNFQPINLTVVPQGIVLDVSEV